MSKRSSNVKSGWVLAALVFALSSFSIARAATLDVGGNGRFSSIQQAVDAAGSGDVLRVAAGTYFESVVVRKSLTILGGFDPDHATQNPAVNVTRVFARATSRAVNLSRPNDVWLLAGKRIPKPQPGWLLIQKMTVRRIESVSSAAGAWQMQLDREDEITTGEAHLVRPRDVVFLITDQLTSGTSRRDAEPVRVHLDGLVIAGGRADRLQGAAADSGGGIHLVCGSQARFTLSRCELIYNSAVRDGGGIFVKMADSAECQITSNTLTHNVCDGTTQTAGGGLAIQLAFGSELRCENNRIGENRSLGEEGEAGGVDIEAESGCYVRFADNSVAGNTAQENAGGLAMRLGLLSLLECTGNHIEANRAVNGSCGGGYVELWGDSRAWLTGDRILDNRAAFACGGLDLWAESESRCEMARSHVNGNEASECGGLRLGAASASQIGLAGLDVTSNRASVGETGGLAVKAQQNSEIKITTVTIAANRAAGDCGGFDLAAERSSSITLTGCVFLRNETDGECGAGRMTGLNNSLMRVDQCQFTENRADKGSNGVGLFDFLDGSLLRFDRCRFVGNRSAAESGVGRLTFGQGSGGEMADCQFRDNATSGSGGIGFVQTTDDSLFRLRRCEISQNEAAGGSYGALCLESYFGSSLHFADTVFEDNLSSGPFAALYAYCDTYTSVTMTGCQFLRNRATGGGYGACAIETQRDSPVSIGSVTVAENIAGGDCGGLYVAVSERSPLAMFDCRIHHNVATQGKCGALAVIAENQSAVSLATIHCWANRAYGDAGAVWIVARNDCPLVIEECDWYDNIAWSEQFRQIALEEAGDDWRVAQKPVSPPIAGAPPAWPMQLGDLMTQGSLTWAIGDVQGDETSPTVQLVGQDRPHRGPALLRRVGGDGGAFVIDQRAGTCLLLRCRIWQNRAGRDHGAGTLTVLDTSDAQVRECSFRDNVAGRDGGATGLWFAYVDRAILGRNAFEGNRAGSREDVATGGFCGGLDLSASNVGLLLSGNSIRDNRAFRCGTSGGDWGGGLLDIEEASALEFVRNAVRGNQADKDAGGIEIGCHDLSTAAVRDNPITDNRAERDFGGLVVAAGIFAPITLEGNEFRSNHAGTCGGGLALRACGSSNGYAVSRNQFSRNDAPAGSAVFVLGTATFQNDLIAGNLDNRAGAVFAAATDTAFSNETIADNPGIAIAVLGGSVRSAARILRHGLSVRGMVDIEATSPSLGAFLLCARHLPVYMIQGVTASRILEAEPTGTANAFRLRIESSDEVTTGDCEIVTEGRWPINLERTGEDWYLTSDRALPSPPEPGQHIVQGAIERFVVDVGGKSPLYLVVLDDDADLANGEAILATPPPKAASLRMINSIVWASTETIQAVGDADVAIAYSDFAGGVRPGRGNISANPRFIAPPKDYRLAAGSPAIDAGTSVGVPRVDLPGALRPLDGTGDGQAAWDLGAYEAASAKKR
jgi:hypothetical protein